LKIRDAFFSFFKNAAKAAWFSFGAGLAFRICHIREAHFFIYAIFRVFKDF
jgi:hypothetical protein